MESRLMSLSYLCFSICVLYLTGFVCLNSFIIDLIRKSLYINISMVIFLFVGVIYSAYVSVRVNVICRRWERDDVKTKVNKILLLGNIAGIRSESSFFTDEDLEGVIAKCIEHLEWRVLFLNYISNILMVIGVLGTFIGLTLSVDAIPLMLQEALIIGVPLDEWGGYLSNAFSSAVIGILSSLCINSLCILNERLNYKLIEWVLI